MGGGRLLVMVWFSETEFLCITALGVLELTLYQAGLNLRGPPASASRILGLKVCAASAWLHLVFFSYRITVLCCFPLGVLNLGLGV